VLSVERVERDRMKDEEGEERKSNGDEERERTNLSHNRKQSNAVIDFLKHHQRKFFVFEREKTSSSHLYAHTQAKPFAERRREKPA